MSFPMNVPSALIISAIHILISFNLKFSKKYKNKFRIYSILVNSSFLIFLVGFPMFLYDAISTPTEAAGIYFEGLATFYFLLFIPLILAMMLLFRMWLFRSDAFSKTTKYITLTGLALLLVGLGIMGYFPFMLFFYGFS
ncbi:hypothetical protein SAMN04488100_1568 [Alkalibacterium putridalgicola]|uniref:Uncharacterized protein n=1 Tax=Alkalibacterium putridalgicola TaxID=426703 RepID=A0A1H7XMD6_9LACT|nr:hypothetical protein [Alkalibacterium putridalgicola]GEK90305.1 hypothetical protein APU01nite_23440 [Alkalibacterium putridalgicola]SEM34940.1 hypothetical protein SAMN04488100_1568 [Alkalibacterium putridalgicola]